MKIEELFPVAYCINLDKRPDRWELVKEEFKKINISVERFPGIYIQDNPAKGCLMSHKEILEMALIENKNVLIFEDDVEFTSVGGSEREGLFKIEYIEKALDELSILPTWDMIFFGGNPMTYFYQISNHLAKLTRSYCLQAYGVNVNFIRNVLHLIDKYENTPIDVIYSDMLMPVTNMFISVPAVAVQRKGYSDIYNVNKNDNELFIQDDRYRKFLVNISF